jgi:hypothetical protein
VPFSEETKLAVKKKSHFSCCLCHAVYVEAHHIVPESEAGSDTEDNAAPLCPSCHETYGGNPDKRKFIREARDCWYEICARRFSGDPDRLKEISELFEHSATKQDVEKVIDQVKDMLEQIKVSSDKIQDQKKKEVSQLTGMLGMTPMGGVSVGRLCKKCGTTIGLFIGDQGCCPKCGTPW